MTVPTLPATPSEWLALVRQTTEVANQMTDPAVRGMLLAIAARYYSLAVQAADRGEA